MKYEKLTEYLFYLFIFLLPWQTIFILHEPMIGGEKWQYGTIGIYLTDIVLVFWIMLLLSRKFWKVISNQFQNLKSKFQIKSKLPITNYQLLVSYFILWSFLSILWSPDKMLAFYFSLKLLLGAGLFLALQKVKINWRKIVFVFLVGAVLQSALAIGQFAFQKSFSGKWLGMSDYKTWQGGVSVLENEGGRWLRAYGSLPHPNILGGYLAAIFLLAVGSYLTIRNKAEMREQDLSRQLFKFFKSPANVALAHIRHLFQRGRSNFLPLEKGELKRDLRPDSNFAKLFILSSLLIILLGILLTFSRGAWLALVVGIIFLGASIWLRTVRPAERNEQSAKDESELPTKKNFIKLVLIFSLAGIVFVGVNYENFSTRFNTEKRLEQKSISERSLYFSQAKEIIKENFWLGTGAGNYTLAVFKKDEIKKPIWQYQPVHNVFMLIWAELGIIGLVLFILILAQIFLKSLKNKSFLCCVLCVVGCILFFDHWLWTTHFGLLLFWLVAALAVKGKFGINMLDRRKKSS